jgi:chromosomal replication initiation ATPase DnaA
LNAYIGDQSAKLVRVALQHLADGHAGCSPLVFYGPATVGKTLLARIAAQRLQEMASPREVLFYSGANLSRACGLATETNSIAEFRRRLQQAGALVIDDLQQVAGKRLVEEELRYAVDELLRRHRWVVATSRSLPSEIKGLASGLASRMQSGRLCRWSPPAAKLNG